VLRRALEPGDDFAPVPAPGPSAWLANHPEEGQTFEQFVRAGYNWLDATRRTLERQPTREELALALGQPLGKINRVLEALRQPISLETPVRDYLT